MVALDDGEQVQLTGYADRLELDADGNVVVVDLKTGAPSPATRRCESHVQLGLYQYAVDHGAVDAPVPDGARRSGGAELVQLGMLDGGPEAVVQSQQRSPRTARPDAAARAARRTARAAARRGVPGGRRPALPRLQLRADLPDQGRRVGDVASDHSATRSDHLADDLAAGDGTPYAPSDQQWAAISAPLSPAVVIAGAGSGKTTLMAARVVYLVVTGQVRPDEVLGLTFTTKAASELRHRIRDALHDRRALSSDASTRTTTTSSSRRSRPTTPTPPACSPTTACGSATSPTPG